jgi:hypothetical protein
MVRGGGSWTHCMEDMGVLEEGGKAGVKWLKVLFILFTTIPFTKLVVSLSPSIPPISSPRLSLGVLHKYPHAGRIR